MSGLNEAMIVNVKLKVGTCVVAASQRNFMFVKFNNKKLGLHFVCFFVSISLI
jgi:hypothetical protein